MRERLWGLWAAGLVTLGVAGAAVAPGEIRAPAAPAPAATPAAASAPAPLGFAASRPADLTPQSQQALAQAARDLADPRFARRQKALDVLWKAGKAAEPALQAALQSPDAEVVWRAQEILDRLRFGLFPDTPADIAELATQYRYGEREVRVGAIEQLVQRGDRGYATLLAIAAGETDPGLRVEVFSRLAAVANAAVPAFFIQGRLAEAQAILEMVSVGGESTACRNYAAFLLLEHRLDERIAQLKDAQPQSRNARMLLVHLYRAQGNLAAARARLTPEVAPPPAVEIPKGDVVAAAASARQVVASGLARDLAYELADWPALAAAQARDVAENADTETLGYLAAYQRLAGQTAEFAQTLTQLRQAADRADEDLSSWYAAKALLLNDRPADAIDLLVRRRQYQPAIELLIAQERFEQAFDLGAQAHAQSDRNLFTVDLALAHAHHRVGAVETARTLLAGLATAPLDTHDTNRLAALIGAEVELGFPDAALEHAAAGVVGLSLDAHIHMLVGSLFPKDAGEAELWWRYLRYKDPTQPHRATLERMRKLIGPGNPPTELATLAKDAMQVLENSPERAKWYTAIGHTCRRAGLKDLAREAFSKAGSSAGFIEEGDLLAGEGRFAEAAQAYARGWEKDRAQTPPNSVALYLEGWALAQAGQAKDGAARMELAALLPLADEARRYQLVLALDERAQPDAAAQQAQWLVQTAKPGAWEIGECLRQQLAPRAVVGGQGLVAAVCLERARLDCLRHNTQLARTEGYLYLADSVHAAAGQGYLAQGQVEPALREISAALEAAPGDVDLIIDTRAPLEKAGHKDQADGLFDRMHRRYTDLLRQYPQSAYAHNALAWLTCKCQRQAEEALPHALRAVELAPTTTAYLDTLAEVYFLRGDKARAIATIRKALALEPESRDLRKQLARFGGK